MVCIIFYDNLEEVMNFIRELEKQKDSDVVVGITVNKDTNSQADEIHSQTVEIYLFRPQNNEGYLNGLFNAFNGLTDMGYSSNWIVFCNTDIKIPRSNFFSMVNNKQFSSDIFCIAPSVYEENRGVYENPQYVERYTLRSLKKRIFIFSHPLFAKLYVSLSQKKAKILKRKKKKSSMVYSAHGSFFILRNDFLKLINRKYMSLMYSEEAFIAEEVRKLNKNIYYDSELDIIHNESQTTGKLNFKAKSKYIAESLQKIKDKYFVKAQVK